METEWKRLRTTMLRDKIKRELRLVQESKNVSSKPKSELLAIIGEMTKGYENKDHPMHNYSNEQVANYFYRQVSEYLPNAK